jgi:hypothetical protein
MRDYKRALYDFSAAIRAESNQAQVQEGFLAEFYMYAGMCNNMLG